MINFSEYKPAIISITVSVAAFLIFLVMLQYAGYTAKKPSVETEHRTIGAMFGDEKALLYSHSIDIPEIKDTAGVSLEVAFGEKFATETCLRQANIQSLDLKQEMLQTDHVTLFDDDWYNQVRLFETYQQTLFAEGYFGLFRVSRPCYNSDRDKAIIYREQDCGSGCGNGEISLLVLRDGLWLPQQRRIVWVAK